MILFIVDCPHPHRTACAQGITIGLGALLILMYIIVTHSTCRCNWKPVHSHSHRAVSSAQVLGRISETSVSWENADSLEVLGYLNSTLFYCHNTLSRLRRVTRLVAGSPHVARQGFGVCRQWPSPSSLKEAITNLFPDDEHFHEACGKRKSKRSC